MIEVTQRISLDDGELEFSYVRAAGPGGQNVNKVSSAVQMRFDARRSPSLPNDVSIRLQRLAGSRLTQDGVIVISASRFRDQQRNRADAIERLVELIRKAEPAPVKRKVTKPTRAAREKRLEGKAKRGAVKSMRQRPMGD
ncbi:alternative ribosome rescue aminoacyl-tRNA hydrolase ArfB [Caulobacter sp. KR2-114]|uniref:alternative ribosome rescue aminoacyl-tRNA hydrolase ArfB n=1 Tax=Caulobacter sp. KR2-114 TaxID=3400912 RepID=UPI003C00C65E